MCSKKLANVKEAPGILYLVATPIGNLGDMTPRAIETLKGVDALLAEDTRVTRKLCNYFDIEVPLIRFDENISQKKIPEMIALLESGKNLALVSDAGTPCVSDPGNNLAAAARDIGLEVVAIPGASAALVALSASGIVGSTFYFGGFVPRKLSEQKAFFQRAGQMNCPCIFFESPHRVSATLHTLAEMFPKREAAFARELTKMHEEIVRLPLPELAAEIARRETIKGEFVIVLGPASEDEKSGASQWDDEALTKLLQTKIEQGLSKSQAVKQAVLETGLARNEVYACALNLERE